MTSSDVDRDTRGRRDGAEPARARHRQGQTPWVPLVAGLLTAFAGLLDLVSALTPGLHSRLHRLNGMVPGALSGAATALTIVTGLLLLLLAKGLRRRKRRAWRGVVALLAASVVLHVVKGLDVEEAIVALALLVGLVLYRDDFRAKGDPRTRWRALWVGLLLAILSVVIGLTLTGVFDLRHMIVGPHSLGDQLTFVVYGLVGVHGPLKFTHDRTADIAFDTMAALGVLTVITVVYLALRPSEPVARLAPEDELEMRALLDRHGRRDSLGYFALRRDKSVVWSPSRKACIAYRVVSGVLLASGDPLGDPEAWPGAITALLDLANEHGWCPAVIGCGETAGTVYARHGLAVLELGDEAIVEVADFTLEGRPMRGVRQAVNRVERAGYTCEVRRVSDITDDERTMLREQAELWRGAETERGFSMALGRFGDPSDPGCVAVMAFKEGKLRAFLHFVPWGPDGLSLDLMRRDRESDNGLNEFLIVSALQHAAELGVTRMSLNFAVFRAALERGEKLGAAWVSKGWRGLLVFVSRWFQIDSLYRFNAKFRPLWEPRFVCYPGATDIPRIALAALEAEAFIVWPTSRLRRVRRLIGFPA